MARDMLEYLQEVLNETAPVLVELKVVELPDKYFKVIIKPKENYRQLFQYADEQELTLTPTDYPLDEKEANRLAKHITKIAQDYVNRNLKVPLLLNLGAVISRSGKFNALRMFMRLCQKGSTYHCSALWTYLSNRLGDLMTYKDPSHIRYVIEDFEAVGLEQLAEFLSNMKYPVALYSKEVQKILPKVITGGIRETLSKYASVYESPEYVPEDKIMQSRELMMNLSEQPEHTWYALVEKPDETPIIHSLSEYAKTNDYVAEALKKTPIEALAVTQEKQQTERELEETEQRAPVAEETAEEEMMNKLRKIFQEMSEEATKLR